MDNLTPGLHYRTYYDNPHNAVPAVSVTKLAEILPHGSGIDGNWTITVNRSGDVIVHGKYHAMDGNGYYCGWRNFRFSIKRAKRNEYHALMGPCSGQYQLTRIKGTAYLMSFVGGGDAKDYLYDSVSIPLADEMGIHSIDSVVVNSEDVARNYNVKE